MSSRWQSIKRTLSVTLSQTVITADAQEQNIPLTHLPTSNRISEKLARLIQSSIQEPMRLGEVVHQEGAGHQCLLPTNPSHAPKLLRK